MPEIAEEDEDQADPFPVTRWSIVARASNLESTEAQAAWTTLCNDYWFPLYAYARRKGSSPEDAEDLTQAFFAMMIRRESLGQAEPGRGRLRAYLLGAFKNFIISEHRKVVAEKRGGHSEPLLLDLAQAEARLAAQASGEDHPDQEYDRRWALQLIDETLKALEKEYVARGRGELFAAFKPYLSCEDARESHADLAEKLGMKKGAVRIAVFRARQRFAQIMRDTIAETVISNAEVDQELAHLFEVFN